MSIPSLPPSPFGPPQPLPITEAEAFRLSLLRPDARARAEAVMRRMMQRGHECPYVGSTRRTQREQEDAVRRGTSSASQTLSWHLLDRAVDFRKRLPGNKPDPTTNDFRFFLDLWECAEDEGMRCLGFERDQAGKPVKLYINNGKLWDPGHCEWRQPYVSLVQATAAEAPYLIA